MNIKIYYLDEKYINYLMEFDNKVPYNKNQTRPYIGIVYTYEGNNYFAPLSSPKDKHLKMNKNAIDIFKIDNGKLGIVNINNMIPAPIECLTEVLPLVKESNYKNLLNKQLTYINDNRKELLNKVQQFQTRYKKGFLSDKILQRCCDFSLLEEKCIEWNRVNNVILTTTNETTLEDLFYIYDNLDDNSSFEKLILKLDKEDTVGYVATLSREELNNLADKYLSDEEEL